MKTTDYICDICGEKRGLHVVPYYGTEYRNVYRFKRIDLKAFISGKNDIKKYDICSECLAKFKKFAKLDSDVIDEAIKIKKMN